MPPLRGCSALASAARRGASHPPDAAPLLPTQAPPGRSRALWTPARIGKWSLRASAAAPEAADPAAETFSELLARVGAADAEGALPVRLQPGAAGRGLFAARDFPSKASVVVKVPLQACLVVDYSKGVQLPAAGGWPRVRGGLGQDDALPWDLIQALTLLDALAGDGGEFWARYAAEVLPPPAAMSLPLCLPEDLLQQLGHPDIADAAREQKRRLAELFPALAVAAGEWGPTWLEWAFAAVRSRAFRLGPDAFALVPFLDVANHAPGEPAANFCVSPDGRSVDLVTLRPVQEGQELTISYSGEEGYTNRRFMAQYGFVPAAGNPFDRLEFRCLADAGDGAAPQTLLSLDAMQESLGDDEAMVEAFSGRDAFTYAALKSLPLAAAESEVAPMGEQLALATTLLAEVEEEQAGWASGMEDDEAELLRLEAAGGGGGGGGDPRVAAVVRYRLHRKKLLTAAARVLKAFLHR